MLAGADSIDDMNVLRHGGMKRLFDAVYAPSTLGSFLRKFTFGHVRQLDAVASRVLGGLSQRAPLVTPHDDDEYVFVDIDDTIIEVHGHQKQGSGYGWSRTVSPPRDVWRGSKTLMFCCGRTPRSTATPRSRRQSQRARPCR